MYECMWVCPLVHDLLKKKRFFWSSTNKKELMIWVTCSIMHSIELRWNSDYIKLR